MKINKLLHKISHGINKVIKEFYKLFYYFIFYWYYQRFHRSCYISPLATVSIKYNKNIGERFVFRHFCQLRGNFKCGHDVRFGYGCNIFGEVEIGNYVMIAPNVVLAGGNHGMKLNNTPMIFQQAMKNNPIQIGNDVWIGANSVVLGGV